LLPFFRQAAKCRQAVEHHFNRVMFTVEVKLHICLNKIEFVNILYAGRIYCGLWTIHVHQASNNRMNKGF